MSAGESAQQSQEPEGAAARVHRQGESGRPAAGWRPAKGVRQVEIVSVHCASKQSQQTGNCRSYYSSENDFNDTSSSDIKRKKLTNPHLQHSSAGDDGAKPMPPRRSSELLRIIEEDLTKPDVDDETAVSTASAESLSVGYWRELAEKRRVALDVSLTENQELHEMNKSLRDQLDVSAAMLNESQNLVEILTEMLEEGDAAGTKEAGGYERGECSKSVLNASLAEEAEEVVEKVEEKTANDADDDESSNISSNTIVGEDETANGDDDNAQSRSGTH